VYPAGRTYRALRVGRRARPLPRHPRRRRPRPARHPARLATAGRCTPAPGTVGGRPYAVFGIGPGDPRGGDAEIGVTEQARYGVLDLHTGEVTVHPAVDHGRTADAAAPSPGVTAALGGATEATPAPAECPTTLRTAGPGPCMPPNCQVAPPPRSQRRPFPGRNSSSQVATDLHTVAWLDMSALATAAPTWRSGSRVASGGWWPAACPSAG
jgi:hypothetical protein